MSALAAVSAAATGFGSLNVYWGQEGFESLRQYCDTGVDYVTLSFVNRAPENEKSGYPGTNFAGHCWAGNYQNKDGVESNLLSECYTIKTDIPYCQERGVKVLLSIGGVYNEQTSNYRVTSVANGKSFADFLWGAFGPYKSSWDGPRPFDLTPFDRIAVDGFDFDIEAQFDNAPYIAMIERFRLHDPSVYIAAAPQCPTDDKFFDLKDMVQNAQLDALFVQFYNNPDCDYLKTGRVGEKFNYDDWEKILANSSKNKNAKLFVGLPGSPEAAPNGGYVSPAQLKEIVCQNKGKKNWGGISLWDVTRAELNKDSKGKSYFQAALEAVKYGCNPVPSVTSTTVQATSTTTLKTSTTTKATTTTSSSTSSKASSTSSTSSKASSTSSTSSKASSTSSTSSKASSTSSTSSKASSTSSTSSKASTSSQVSSTSTKVSSTSSKPSSTSKASSTSQASSTSKVSSTSQVSSTSKASTSSQASSTSKASSTSQVSSTSQASSASASSSVVVAPPSSSKAASSAPASTSSTPVASSSSIGTSEIPRGSTSSSAVASSSSVVIVPSDSTTSSAVLPTSSVESFVLPSSTFSWSNSSSVVTKPADSSASVPTSSARLTTSTVYTTKVSTVTKCPPTVTNCPNGGYVTTETIPLYTTVCPVTESEGAKPTTTEAPESLTTSTVYTTKTYVVTACPPEVVNCPVGQVTTEVTSYTTVCPVTATENVPSVSAKASGSPSGLITSTRSAVITSAPVILNPVPVPSGTPAWSNGTYAVPSGSYSKPVDTPTVSSASSEKPSGTHPEPSKTPVVPPASGASGLTVGLAGLLGMTALQVLFL